jgi:hypothetical protein
MFIPDAFGSYYKSKCRGMSSLMNKGHLEWLKKANGRVRVQHEWIKGLAGKMTKWIDAAGAGRATMGWRRRLRGRGGGGERRREIRRVLVEEGR